MCGGDGGCVRRGRDGQRRVAPSPLDRQHARLMILMMTTRATLSTVDQVAVVVHVYIRSGCS